MTTNRRMTPARCTIVPPYLLERLAALSDESLAHAAESARRSLLVDAPFREVRAGEQPPMAPRTALPPTAGESGGAGTVSAVTGVVRRTIWSAGNRETLPGDIVRREADAPTADPAVTEAFDGLGDTHALLWQVFDRASIDGHDLPLDASVHYGRDYDNAFWDGTRMVFGDGDGQIFTRFTASLSVIGHELAHGVTQYTANLDYVGQSGALNESISDVFGALVEQYTLRQSVEEASWLIGLGLFTDQVEGSALRSMSHPGTAYDDDILGTDPQPAHMRDYIETDDDNGGVHLNSGIPNRAFYLAAQALGGNAWEAAGQIWFDTLTGGGLAHDVEFAAFAEATARAAITRYGDDSAEHRAVVEGWAGVGLG
ncbi:M4 family metallopeptidase [Compostimonas suwonensis]|uniref:Neutral metalloproteinase n=1 Tax=Compostimonas suwonensis TaxID=1048394 RepID=A0A2M9BTV7_9MICO|nr:M4 family metallopeptidase [Compostimonas suwonensis]PJJ61388.1 thermolysin metallopeptidase-like protein [Compostimonas suwonensis]